MDGVTLVMSIPLPHIPFQPPRGSAHVLALCGAQGCRLSHLVLETNVCGKAKDDDPYSNAIPKQYPEAFTMADQRSPLG